jgi:iron(III) transport system permease protein
MVGGALLLAPVAAILTGWNTPPIDVPSMPSHAFATLALTFGAAFGAALIGIPLAFAVHALPRKTRFAALAVLALPLALPSYVHAIAWSAWLGFAPAGVAGLRVISAAVSGEVACVWVWTMYFAPLVMLTTYGALNSWSAASSEAAAASGVSPLRLRWLRARDAAPMIESGMLLVAIFAYSDFVVPDFFAVGTYATGVFVQLSAYGDIHGAVRASVPAFLIALMAAMILVRTWARSERNQQVSVRPSAAATQSNTGTVRVTMLVVGVGLLLTLVMPLASLLGMIRSPSDFLVAANVLRDEAATSFGLAGATALFTALLGIAGSHTVARGTIPAPWVVRGAVLGTLALPSAALGLGAILLWNRPGAMGWVYVTGLALVLALVARFWPIGVELGARAWAQLPVSLEEAAYVAGRTPTAMLWHIGLPQLWRAWLGIAFVVAILALNELAMLTLLAPPGMSTMSLRIFSTVHYGPASLLAALCALQVALVAALLVAAWWLVGANRLGTTQC